MRVLIQGNHVQHLWESSFSTLASQMPHLNMKLTHNHNCAAAFSNTT